MQTWTWRRKCFLCSPHDLRQCKLTAVQNISGVHDLPGRMLQVNGSKHARLQSLAGRLGESLVAGDIAALACLNSRQSASVNFQPIQPCSSKPVDGQSPDSVAQDNGIAAAMRYLQGSSQQTIPPAADYTASTKSASDSAAAVSASEVPPRPRQHAEQQQLFLPPAADASAKPTRVERIISEWPPPAGGKLGSPESPETLQQSDQSDAEALTADVGLQAAQHFAQLAKLGSMDPDKAASAGMHLLGKSLSMHIVEQQALESPDETALQQLTDVICSCLAVSSSPNFPDVLRWY